MRTVWNRDEAGRWDDGNTELGDLRLVENKRILVKISLGDTLVILKNIRLPKAFFLTCVFSSLHNENALFFSLLVFFAL